MTSNELRFRIGNARGSLHDAELGQRSWLTSSALFVLIACGLLIPPRALAAPSEFSWSNPAGGDYSVGANWTPAGPPGSGDDAVLNLSTSYTVTAPAGGTGLRFGARTLQVGNDRVTLDLKRATFALSDTNSNLTNTITVAAKAGEVGSLTLQNGKLEGSSTVVGRAAGSQGTLLIDGAAGPATFVDTQTTEALGVVIGESGVGNLRIRNGARVELNSALVAGKNVGSTGNISIDGAGSLLLVNSASSDPSRVGFQGTATLSVLNGAALLRNGSPGTSLRLEVGTQGSVIVDGVGSRIIGSVHVDGSLAVTNGGRVSSVDVDTITPVVVDGPGSSLTSVHFRNSAGRVVAQNGAKVEIVRVDRGVLVADGVTTNVGSGNGATVGTWNSTGSLLIQNGAQMLSSSLSIESKIAGVPSQVTVTGPGSTIAVDGPLGVFVGGSWDGSTGRGNLAVVNSASVNVAGPLTNYDSGTITLRNGGVLTAIGPMTNDRHGTVDVGIGATLTANLANRGTTFLNGTLDGNFSNVITGLLYGTGTITGSLNIGIASEFTTGSLPGVLAAGDTVWEPSTIFDFQINSATGGAGESTGWGLFKVNGVLALGGVDAPSILIKLITRASDGSYADLPDFDPTQSHAWTFATASGGITGFSPGGFTVNTTFFGNDFEGRFAVEQVADSLVLAYTVPEPSGIALAGIASVGVAIAVSRSKRWKRNSALAQ